MRKNRVKKSETLEVRISYETKRKLAEQARTENRTVSEIIRQQIDQYLNLDSPSMIRHSSNWISNKTRAIIAAAITLLLFSLSSFSPSTAEQIGLVISGSIEHTESESPKSFFENSFVTNMIIDLDADEAVELPLGHETITIKLFARPAKFGFDQDGVEFELLIGEIADGKEELLVRPKITTVYGSPAQFEISSDPARLYKFTVIPNRG